MVRPLVAGALAAGLLISAGIPGTHGQDKKGQPKKKDRIAIAEPTDAAKDPDFGIQGEYVGKIAGNRAAVQVVARGNGEFDVKILPGGVPGDGWDGKTSAKATAKRNDDGTATISGTNTTGVIARGGVTLKLGLTEGTLMRVERMSDTLGAKPPAGAVVLFGKEGDEVNWAGGRLMPLSDGKFLTPARVGDKGGSIKSKEKFGAFKAHVEFRLPWMPNSTGQGRGNSGVYLQDRYECQVLDSFGLSGENNECGGIYTQHKPSVNMCLPPMVWQTYDIDFTPAAFDADGKKTKNARATIFHNGVKIHDNVEFPKACPGGQPEKADPGPFQFQDHGDPVIFRNVWVVPVK